MDCSLWHPRRARCSHDRYVALLAVVRACADAHTFQTEEGLFTSGQIVRRKPEATRVLLKIFDDHDSLLGGRRRRLVAGLKALVRVILHDVLVVAAEVLR